jgi:hypothetical protein
MNQGIAEFDKSLSGTIIKGLDGLVMTWKKSVVFSPKTILNTYYPTTTTHFWHAS